MHRYRPCQHQVLHKGPDDITPRKSKVLGMINRHPGGTQAQLAALLQRVHADPDPED
jgi:hypothetical protein